MSKPPWSRTFPGAWLAALVIAASGPQAGTAQLFGDGFESGTTCRWSAAIPEDVPPGVDCGLSTFLPSSSFIRVGATNAPTIPDPLTARLHRPAGTPTFVAVSSADPAALVVVDGGVTVAPGETDAVVLLNALAQHPGVTLTASLGTVQLSANVRVVSDTEVPVLADLQPAEVTVPPGGVVAFTVRLDIPAPAGGTPVDLSVTGGIGTAPPQVVVAGDEIAATFEFVAGNTEGDGTVTASLGASSLSALVHVQP